MMNWPEMLKLMPKLLIIIGKISLGIKYIVASRHELILLVETSKTWNDQPVESHKEEDKEDTKTKTDTIFGVCGILNKYCRQSCFTRKTYDDTNATCHNKLTSAESVNKETIKQVSWHGRQVKESNQQ